MGAFNAAGTRITKGSFPATTATVPAGDVLMTLTADVYADAPYESENTPKNRGKKRTQRSLWKRAGAVVKQSEIDALYEAASIATVSPASGPAAGGTTLTLTGVGLSGVTAVTVGGTAATAVTVVDGTKVTCVTAARAAASGLSVVATDDSGTVTKTSAYAYV